MQFDGEPSRSGRSPEFNEHGGDFLRELGLDDEAIIDLKIGFDLRFPATTGDHPEPTPEATEM